MNQVTLYAITAPITALVCCSFFSLFMKRMKMPPLRRCIIVFVVYALFTFAMGAGGEGIFSLDYANYNWTQYIFRLAAGFCVCLFLFLFYSRADLAMKLEEKKKSKGKK